MAEHYDAAVIGFGKAGKTMAEKLAGMGKKVLMAERSDQMYGGSCPNVACLPTKLLLLSKLCSAEERSFAEKASRYADAIAEKQRFTAKQRQSNYNRLAKAGVTIVTGQASFADSHRIDIACETGSQQATADYFFINAGSRPFIPDIPGLKNCRNAYTSESLLNRSELPKRLLILGGGYIGLEFAGIYRNFGSEVTILQDGKTFLPREDEEIAQAILTRLGDMGVRFQPGAKVKEVRENNGEVEAVGEIDGQKQSWRCDAILVATGRRPNTQDLHVEKAGVTLTPKSGILTDKHLRTAAPHIFAMGNIVGGMLFTYISLDDFRIVYDCLFGESKRTTENRGAVPFSTFFDPSFSRVGVTEREAREQGREIKVFRAPASVVPKANVLGRGQPVGLLKAVVDKETDRLLGVHLFCEESHEPIHLAKLAIDANMPYTVLRDMIISHPTMCEAYNFMF